jgi:hypothetical protein
MVVEPLRVLLVISNNWSALGRVLLVNKNLLQTMQREAVFLLLLWMSPVVTSSQCLSPHDGFTQSVAWYARSATRLQTLSLEQE